MKLMKMSKGPFKTLIVGPSWIGDMVLAQSLFKFLKIRNPDKEIDVIAPAWTRPLLELMPEVNNAIPIPGLHGCLALGMRLRMGRYLSKQNYNHAIVVPRSFKSAIVPFVAHVKRRTGFLGELRWGMLNDIRKLKGKTLYRTVDRFIELGLEPGETMPETIPEPSLKIPTQNGIATLLILGEKPPEAPILGICPGVEYGPAKRWPTKHFATVANTKLEEGWQVWLFGSKKDTAINKEIQALTKGRCLDLAGRTTLTESISLMSLTTAVLSNDSGLMHVAAALGRITIAVFGSSDPLCTPPLSNKAKILYLGLSCSPCFKRKCPLGHLNCLNDLLPEQVLTALQKNLLNNSLTKEVNNDITSFPSSGK